MSATPDTPSLAALVEAMVTAAFDAGWHVGSVPHAQVCAAAKATLLSAIERLEADLVKVTALNERQERWLDRYRSAVDAIQAENAALRERGAELSPPAHAHWVAVSTGLVDQMAAESEPVTVQITRRDERTMELLFTRHVCATPAPGGEHE